MGEKGEPASARLRNKQWNTVLAPVPSWLVPQEHEEAKEMQVRVKRESGEGEGTSTTEPRGHMWVCLLLPEFSAGD